MLAGTGSNPTAETRLQDPAPRSRLSPRTRAILGFVGAAVALGILAAVIVPRADEVGDALGRVGIARFALVVVLGICALVCRTAAWQVAIDAAGGRVRAPEAHSASAVSYLVAMLSTYLGVITRIALIRHRVPDRSPTTPQQIAAESALVVVEGAIVGFLLLCCSWTLGIPFLEALAIFIAGVAAVFVLVIAARRLAPRRFGAGLAVARDPRTLALVALAISGTVLAQIVRVAVTLGSVGLGYLPIHRGGRLSGKRSRRCHPDRHGRLRRRCSIDRGVGRGELGGRRDGRRSGAERRTSGSALSMCSPQWGRPRCWTDQLGAHAHERG